MIQALKKAPFPGRPGPLLFVVMDGVGIGPADDTNAVYTAKTPVLDKLMACPWHVPLKAHGKAVGLPSDKDMGNSEVGHNTIGAGRVYDQGAKLVNASIQSRRIFSSRHWQELMRRGRDNTLHFIGLLSDGNVHSHIDQLFALIRECAGGDMPRVRLHILLDGRDVGEKSALTYIDRTEALLARVRRDKGLDYRIASGGGRMRVTMDRYNADWRIVARGWQAHVLGQARAFPSARDAVKTFYQEDADIIDQYLPAFVIVDAQGRPVGPITDGDGVVFFNFRGDRAIEISRAFDEAAFSAFDRRRFPDVYYCGMMLYDGDLGIPNHYLVEPPHISQTASDYLCATGVSMYAISETQKFGHVTYFWNGNNSGYVCPDLEKYEEIASDKIEFDKAPDMKAREIRDAMATVLRSGEYRFCRLNFANGDMVGHTGNFAAAVRAVATVDRCVGDLLKVVKETRGLAIITADHGNSDEMIKLKNGQRTVSTAHSLNPVPFIIYDPGFHGEYRLAGVQQPGLANIAATFINLLGYEAPAQYAPSLLTWSVK